MKSAQKKYLSAIMFVFIVLSMVAPPVYGSKTGSIFDFVKKLVKQNPKKLRKIAKEIPSASSLKKIDVADIKKALPDLNLKKFTPDVLKLSSIGKKIANTGPFGKKFINSVSNPAEAIQQYGRYGAAYINTGESFSKTVMNHTGNLANLSAKELKKYGNLSKKTIAKFGKADFVNSSFTNTVRRTGKHGYETIKKIGNWAKKHPKSSAAAALLIWYSTDPEGCTDAIGDVSEFLAKGGAEIAARVSEGVGKGVTATVMEQWQNPSRQYIITGAVILLFIFAIYSRLTRRILFLPFKIASAKMNVYMDKKEGRLDKSKQNRPVIKRVKKKTHPKKSAVSADNDEKTTGLF